MDAPKYKPESWLRYNRGQGQAVGKVVGAINSNGEHWSYYVTNAAAQGQNYIVREGDVVEEISLD